MRDKFDNQFATLRLLEEIDSVEEDSVTGPGEAYLGKKYRKLKETDIGPLYSGYQEYVGPSPDNIPFVMITLNDGRTMKIAKDKIKGGAKMYDKIVESLKNKAYHNINSIIKDIENNGNLGEDKYSGYQELKNFKPGHTPDRGGFQFKQMWEVEGNEDFKVGDKVKIKMKGDPHNDKKAEVVGVSTPANYYDVKLDNGTPLRYHEKNLQKLDIEEDQADLNETFTNDDYIKVTALLDDIKYGSKLYRKILNLVLDLYPYKYSDVEALLSDDPEKAYKPKKPVNENYSRFKKETVTRSKAQQMHEAAKAIEKKLKEVNRLLEYSAQLRTELSEGKDFQYNHHTLKVVERITTRIAEAYTKSKKLK